MTVETSPVKHATMICDGDHFKYFLLKAFSSAGDTFASFPSLIFELSSAHHRACGVEICSELLHAHLSKNLKNVSNISRQVFRIRPIRRLLCVCVYNAGELGHGSKKVSRLLFLVLANNKYEYHTRPKFCLPIVISLVEMALQSTSQKIATLY